MIGHNNYHGMIRKYIIVFGSLFDDISVYRKNRAGDVVQQVAVPIAYGPKEKWLSRISQDPSLNKYIDVTLPRIGFEMMSLTYDPQRKLSSTQQNVRSVPDVDNAVLSQFVPVPYNLDMTLSIFTRNAEDGAMIIEQILPYFTPDFTVSVNAIPEMDIKMDIPIVLTGVTTTDVYDGDFETRRSLTWDLNFTIKGYIYGPVKKSGVIKRVVANANIVPGSDPVVQSDIGTTARVDRIVTQPGLTAAGEPTTSIPDSISHTLINAQDPYGFAQNVNLYTDGKVYDPVTGNDVVLE